MKRALALYNLAKVIVEQCIDERGSRTDLIEYVSGKRPALSTLSNAEIADRLEFITGEERTEVTGGKTPDPDRPIELPLSRHEAVLLSSLILARSERMAVSVARATYPDTGAGRFAKRCDERYLEELQGMASRIGQKVRGLDVAKKQQHTQDGLTDPED